MEKGCSSAFSTDVIRAMVFRNSWTTQGERHPASSMLPPRGARGSGQEAVADSIDDRFLGTSVTVLLVGEKTCNSKWVGSRDRADEERGNGLLGIDVSKIKDFDSNTSQRCGKIPAGYPFYLWNNDDGYNNIGTWIEEAAKAAGK